MKYNSIPIELESILTEEEIAKMEIIVTIPLEEERKCENECRATSFSRC